VGGVMWRSRRKGGRVVGRKERRARYKEHGGRRQRGVRWSRGDGGDDDDDNGWMMVGRGRGKKKKEFWRDGERQKRAVDGFDIDGCRDKCARTRFSAEGSDRVTNY
jgi:hypothetical protein